MPVADALVAPMTLRLAGSSSGKKTPASDTTYIDGHITGPADEGGQTVGF